MTKKISNMIAAGTLTGAELQEVVQDGISRRITIQHIVDLSEQQDVAPPDSYTVNVLTSAGVYSDAAVAAHWADNIFLGQEVAVLNDFVITPNSLVTGFNNIVISAGNFALDTAGHMAIGNNNNGIDYGGILSIPLYIGDISGDAVDYYRGTEFDFTHDRNSGSTITYGISLAIKAGDNMANAGEMTSLLSNASVSPEGITINTIKGAQIAASLQADNANVKELIGVDARTFSTGDNSIIGDTISLKTRTLYGSSQDSIVSGGAYGILITAPSAPQSGLNLFGLYIEEQSTANFTNKYNIYSAGANSINKFEGQVETPNMYVSKEAAILDDFIITSTNSIHLSAGATNPTHVQMDTGVFDVWTYAPGNGALVNVINSQNDILKIGAQHGTHLYFTLGSSPTLQARSGTDVWFEIDAINASFTLGQSSQGQVKVDGNLEKVILFDGVVDVMQTYQERIGSGIQLMSANNIDIAEIFVGDRDFLSYPVLGDLVIHSTNDIYVSGGQINLVNDTLIGLTVSGGTLLAENIKSGPSQVGAGAVTNEVWKTASHASLPDNVLMIGV